MPRVVPRDVDGNHIIAAALGAGADLVVSGDADLLSIGTFEGIPFVSTAEAVKRVRQHAQLDPGAGHDAAA